MILMIKGIEMVKDFLYLGYIAIWRLKPRNQKQLKLGRAAMKEPEKILKCKEVCLETKAKNGSPMHWYLCYLQMWKTDNDKSLHRKNDSEDEKSFIDPMVSENADT